MVVECSIFKGKMHQKRTRRSQDVWTGEYFLLMIDWEKVARRLKAMDEDKKAGSDRRRASKLSSRAQPRPVGAQLHEAQHPAVFHVSSYSRHDKLEVVDECEGICDCEGRSKRENVNPSRIGGSWAGWRATTMEALLFNVRRHLFFSVPTLILLSYRLTMASSRASSAATSPAF